MVFGLWSRSDAGSGSRDHVQTLQVAKPTASNDKKNGQRERAGARAILQRSSGHFGREVRGIKQSVFGRIGKFRSCRSTRDGVVARLNVEALDGVREREVDLMKESIDGRRALRRERLEDEVIAGDRVYLRVGVVADERREPCAT